MLSNPLERACEFTDPTFFEQITASPFWVVPPTALAQHASPLQRTLSQVFVDVGDTLGAFKPA